MFEDKLKAEATLEHFQAGAGSALRDSVALRGSFRAGDSLSGETTPKSSGKGRLRNSMRRASAVALAATAFQGDKMVKTKAELDADAAKKEALAKELKREAGQLSTKIVKYSETMMRFGLRTFSMSTVPSRKPLCKSNRHVLTWCIYISALDHVERFVERVAVRHGLPEERVDKDVKEKVFASAPRFVHLQPITDEG